MTTDRKEDHHVTSPSFSFFDTESLPAPRLSPAEAENLVRELYGIDCIATELGSQQDANFLITAAAGQLVLKVSNPAFTAADLDAQNRAAAHVHRCDPTIRIPMPVVSRDEQTVVPVHVDRVSTVARLVTYVEGDGLATSSYLAPDVLTALGALSARISCALASFNEPLPSRELQWDLRHASQVVSRLADFVTVPGGTTAAKAAATVAHRQVTAVAERLPVQVVHGDLTQDNVIGERDDEGHLRPSGVIDFGDLTRTWAVTELAVTCASLLVYADGDPTVILPTIRGFDSVRPLSDDELDALWPLIVLRASALMVSGQHQAQVDASNQYATANLGTEWTIFREATAVPQRVMTAVIRGTLRGTGLPPVASGHPTITARGCTVLDVSTTSAVLDGGVFLADDAETGLAADALADGAVDLVYLPYRQPRLTRTELNSFVAPSSVPMGVEVFAHDAVDVLAPWSGTVEVHDGAVALPGDGGQTLWLTGPLRGARRGQTLDAGDVIGRLDAQAGSLRVQVCQLDTPPPFLVPAALADGWAHVCPDPTALVDPERPIPRLRNDSRAELARRGAFFATPQEHYFRDPPQIERGWRHHLFDIDGRAYLDMLNNVSILGHGHPRLADAVARQWRLLNTNSRFHYQAVAEYSQRLAELLPDPLDTVFLVNSGTEANDLALRLAWAHTGRREVVAVQEAYHGWSDATDAISTSVADNPNALTTRPDWVHTVAAPNSFRGQYRGAQVHRYAEDAVQTIREMSAKGVPPAAFLSETFYGNAGGMALPAGYLRTLYDAVRVAGGLCIADEVQVGYGRLGDYFWGFEEQGVVPDIVTVAKAIGNGHPLGAVVTTKEIAEAYRSQGYFFSSAGGSPVSCVAGVTVLDILAEEKLQDNARTVGGHLRNRLLDLADRHDLIGAVHGMGLYLGVEMVRDRATLAPATAETAAICERMRELGVMMQPTSDRLCVLKIKPPLGVGIDDVDFFADTLDRVLSTGW